MILRIGQNLKLKAFVDASLGREMSLSDDGPQNIGVLIEMGLLAVKLLLSIRSIVTPREWRRTSALSA
jgi:hypothetical protein